MEKTVQNLLDDWNALAHLYEAVIEFAEIYNSKYHLAMPKVLSEPL